MPNKETAKEELRKLVQRYHEHKQTITNEEQTCQSLVLPFFSKVLGWDTENPSEFKAQDSQKSGKRSDYIAFLNGISQFVIEVKGATKIIKPILQGRNIKRYNYEWNNEWLIFIPWHFPLHEDLSINGASHQTEERFRKEYPAIYKHMLKFKKELIDRNKEETGIRYEWYALQRCAASYYQEFEKEKIIWGLTADKWAFAYDNGKNYLPSNGYILTSENTPVNFILAQLNSSLLRFYFGIIGVMTAGGAYTLKHETISELPIYLAEKAKIDKTVTLVDKMLSLHKRLNEIGDKMTVERQRIEEDIKKIDAEIDELVYGLYGITDEEKRIIEESLK